MEWHTLGGGVDLDHVVELVLDAQGWCSSSRVESTTCCLSPSSYITKSLHYGGWRQGSMNPLNISFDNYYISNFIWYQVSWLSFWIHKCSSLQKLTHVGRWTQIPSGAPNSWWATSTLSNPHKFNYMDNTTNQGMLFHLREALLQVMS